MATRQVFTCRVFLPHPLASPFERGGANLRFAPERVPKPSPGGECGTANTVTLSYLTSDYNQIDNPNPDDAPELKGGSGIPPGLLPLRRVLKIGVGAPDVGLPAVGKGHRGEFGRHGHHPLVLRAKLQRPGDQIDAVRVHRRDDVQRAQVQQLLGAYASKALPRCI